MKKKDLKPIPEIGKTYHCFDDGKIRFSRHYLIKVDGVYGYMEFKKKFPTWFARYLEHKKDHDYLFAKTTDKFVLSEHGEDNTRQVFARTKWGGWFSIGDFMNSGQLDVTGELWDNLIKDIDRFDLTPEEKEKYLNLKIV